MGAMGIGSSLSVLRQRTYLLILAARATSVFGNGLGVVALAFGLLGLPGFNAGRLSIVVAFETVPPIVLILVGGVIADRIPRRTILIASDLIAAGAWIVLSACVFAEQSSMLILCVATLVAGTASAALLPAIGGIVPEIVAREHLQSANGLLRVAQNFSMLAGLLLGGLLVSVFGASWALLMNAWSFMLSAVLIGLARLRGRVQTGTSFVGDLRRGAREFFSRPWLWVVVVQYFFVTAASDAYLTVLGPVIARSSLSGPRSWSLITAAQSLGTIVGAAVALRLRVSRPILCAVVITPLLALSPISLSVAHSASFVIPTSFLAGIVTDVFGVLWVTTVQYEIPTEALSRVYSFDMLGSLAAVPVGIVVAGRLAETFGAHMTVFLCGVLIVLVSILAVTSPSVRSLQVTRSIDGTDAAVDG